MRPRIPVLPCEQPIGLVIANHAPLHWIPCERTAERHRMVRQNAARSRDISLLDIRHRLAARSDRLQEILHVTANRGRAMLFQILLGLVLRELLQLINYVLVDRLRALGARREVVTHDARLQRAFISVESRAPRILWIGRIAPTAML